MFTCSWEVGLIKFILNWISRAYIEQSETHQDHQAGANVSAWTACALVHVRGGWLKESCWIIYRTYPVLPAVRHIRLLSSVPSQSRCGSTTDQICADAAPMKSIRREFQRRSASEHVQCKRNTHCWLVIKSCWGEITPDPQGFDTYSRVIAPSRAGLKIMFIKNTLTFKVSRRTEW